MQFARGRREPGLKPALTKIPEAERSKWRLVFANGRLYQHIAEAIRASCRAIRRLTKCGTCEDEDVKQRSRQDRQARLVGEKRWFFHATPLSCYSPLRLERRDLLASRVSTVNSSSIFNGNWSPPRNRL